LEKAFVYHIDSVYNLSRKTFCYIYIIDMALIHSADLLTYLYVFIDVIDVDEMRKSAILIFKQTE